MEKVKKYKIFIVISIVLLVLFGVYCTAKALTSKSYSSEGYVREQQAKAEESQNKVSVEKVEVPDDSYATEKSFDLDNEIKGNMSKAKLVYNKENLDVRQQEYLGDTYPKYKDVLDEINNSYENIFKDLVKRDYITTENSIRYSDVVDKPELDVQELSSYDYASFNDSLTAIGFYGDTCVLCAYNYPNNPSMSLVLIDYSEHEFVLSSENNAFDFGDTIDVSIMPKQGKVQSISGWQVFFIKG